MTPDICLYHGNCQDGFTAAWAVWKRYGDAIEYVGCDHGKRPPDVTGKHVLMVDFSYRRGDLEDMALGAKSISVLDHHKTAQAELERFAVLNPVAYNDIEDILAATQPGLGNIRAIFDMEKSGAMLAWEFCHPGEPVPALIDYVQDRDLWRHALPDSREIAAMIFAYEYNFANWDYLERSLSTETGRDMVALGGAAIEKKHHKDVAELVATTRRPMTIGGYEVDVANLPYTMASDAAHLLAAAAPFGACYFDRNDGQRVFSLRSDDFGIDVSEIAKLYGGGGHARAAGFQQDIGWEGEEGENSKKWQTRSPPR